MLVAVLQLGLAAVKPRRELVLHAGQSALAELKYCDEHGIAFLPWSPLGGTGGGGRKVGDEFAAFGEIAADHGVSPQQVVLAWELSLSEHLIPIPGARRAESIIDSAKAADLVLSAEELARCNASVGRR